MRLAIVALGPSADSYIRTVEGQGDPTSLYDEVWLVNGFSNVLWSEVGGIRCRGFAMDDVRIQELRAKGGNKKVANMLESYKRHPGPIYTSRAHKDYPALVEFPLEQVMNACSVQRDYLNSTVAYPLALAIAENATAISLYGADYTFPNRHEAEKGRGCVEWWLARAETRGIKIGLPTDTSILDMNCDGHPYGYDLCKITRTKDVNGYTKYQIEDLPEDMWPTAEQIEKNYYKGIPQP